MKLSMKEVAYIAKMFEGITPVSLLANLEDLEDGSELFSLMEKEVILEDELSPAAKPIFKTLANARQSGRLFVKDRFCMIEKYAYRFNGDTVLVENDEGEMAISLPEDMGIVSEEISEVVGRSTMKAVDIDVVLSHEALLVLAGVIDLYRENILKTYVGGMTEKSGVTVRAIYNAMAEAKENQLCYLLTTNYGIAIPEIGKIKDVIDGLVEKSCLRAETISPEKARGNESEQLPVYELTERYEALSRGLLMPETLITLEQIGYNDNNELISASSLCISAGHRDMIFIAFGSEDAELATISGAGLMRVIENVLSCPEMQTI